MMNELIVKWHNANEQLKYYKKLELQLRMEITGHYPGELGTQHYVLDEDHKLTIVRSVNRTIDDAILDIIWNDLTDKERECIRIKHEIKAREYGKLEDDNLLSHAVTVKPALPSVKLEVLDDDS